MKIRTKLSIFPIALAIIMLIASLLITIFISKSIIQKQVGNHLWTTAQSRAHNIETLLNDYKKTVQILSVGIPFTNVLDPTIDYTRRMMECNLRIKRTIEIDPDISRIRILDTNGIVICSSHEDVGLDRTAEEIFLKVKDNVYIGEIHKSEYTGNLVLSISTPIFVRDTFSGVVIINFNVEEKLYEIVTDRTGLGKTGEIYLVNKDGYLLTSSRFIDVEILKTKINTEQVNLYLLEHVEKEFSPEMEEKPTIYTNFAGKKVLGVHYFIAEMQWGLIAEFDVQEANKPMNKLAFLLIIIFSILLILTIIVSLIISKNITFPIEELHRGAEEIIKGNLDYKVGLKSKDEIGQLSQAFDSMTARLTESQKELEKHAEKLEEEVKQRTRELANKIAEIEQQRISTVNIANDLEEINITLTNEIDERKKIDAELKISEKKYRALVENIQDGVFAIYEAKMLFVNKAFAKMTGYSEEELIGMDFINLIAPEDVDMVVDLYYRRQAGEDVPSEYEFSMLHKDKTTRIIVNMNVGLVHYKNSVASMGTVKDITERKQAEKMQETLYNISNAISTIDDVHLLYKQIREFLGNVIDTTNFYIALYDEKTDVISLPFEVDEKDKYKSFPAGKTLTKYVIQLEKPLFAPRKLQDELTEQGEIDIVGTPSEIWLGAPLKVENSVIGVIAVQSYDDPNLYTEKDLEMLTFISEEIALAIRHKQAEEDLKNAHEELQKRLHELEIFHNATMGREDRIIELKHQVNELLEKLGKEKKYKV